jgi:hypothetical protein
MLIFTFKSRGQFEEEIVAAFSEGFIKKGISAWISPKDFSSINTPLDFLLFFFLTTGEVPRKNF